MALTILDSLCLGGDGEHNEDLCGAAGDAAWVLDGATGVSPPGGLAADLAEGTSDAAWYVARFDAALRDAIAAQPGAETRTLLRRAMGAVEADYRDALGGRPGPGFPHPFPPSAAFVMARRMEDGLEIVGLGDCAALFAAADGRIGCFTGDHASPIDKESIARLKAEQEKHPDAPHREIIERMKPVLRRNRARMNTPEGYWILSFSSEALEHMRAARVSIAHDKPVMLMSDGFTRCLQMPDRISEAQLYERVLSNGAAQTAAALRRAEEEDASCRRFPRFKKSDDAACLVVSFGP